MTRSEIVDLLEARQPLWNRRDALGLAAAHAEHGKVISPIFGTVVGREAITASYFQLFSVFDDWDLTTSDLIVDGQRAAQLFTVQAVHAHDLFGVAATGRRFEIHGVQYLDFDGRFIQTERRLYDFTGMLVQLGVIKARPGK